MKTSISNVNTIDREIISISRSLSEMVDKDEVVIIERPSRGVSCKAFVCVYNAADLKHHNDDRSFKARPIVRYALYPNVSFPSRLGSIAIYGDNALAHCRFLRRQSTLFGHRIISAEVEQGRRPFVDVRLAL